MARLSSILLFFTALCWSAPAAAGDRAKCKHGFAGWDEVIRVSGPEVALAEREKAQRAGRAADPTPAQGVLDIQIYRRPALHADGRFFDFAFVVDGVEVHRQVGQPAPARNLANAPPGAPWRNHFVVDVPDDLAGDFLFQLVDKSLAYHCAVNVKENGKIARTQPVLTR